MVHRGKVGFWPGIPCKELILAIAPITCTHREGDFERMVKPILKTE